MQDINWTKWSSIAEIFSAIAILVTLVYLAVQTQQNTAAVQASTRQAMLAEDREFLSAAAANPMLATLLFRDQETLTDLEKAQVHGLLSRLIRIRENQYSQFRNGAIDRDTFESFLSSTARTLSIPLPRVWWEKNARVSIPTTWPSSTRH